MTRPETTRRSASPGSPYEARSARRDATEAIPTANVRLQEAACAARRARQKAARQRACRQRRTALVAVLALAVLALGWRVLAPDQVGTAVAERAAAPAALPELTAAANEAESVFPATPIFATYKDLQLHLPVREEDLTEIGFHQSSWNKGLPMVSLLPDADMAAAGQKRGTGRVFEERDPDDPYPPVLDGSVLRMWRTGHVGQPDSAADVGAPPGSPVITPVSGVVTVVKTYELYGQHEDLEIHIRPSGHPEIDLVIIHVTDATVKPGDLVVGGITRIASVRLLHDRVDHQLALYTADYGDHVHLQLNPAGHPEKAPAAEDD